MAASASPASDEFDSSAIRATLDKDSGVLARPCFRVEFVKDATRASECEVIAIVGHKSSLPGAIGRLESLPGDVSSLLLGMLSDIPEPRTSPEVRETSMGARIFIVVLPTACSRHNSPEQPHAVTAALNRIPFSGPCMVITAPPEVDGEYGFSHFSAVARAFPMYSRKTGEAARAMRRTTIQVLVHRGTGGSDGDDGLYADMAQSTRIAAALVDAPTSELHTDAFVDIALKVASERKATSVSVIRGTDLRDRGFGGLWGVGKAATHPPALVVLGYCPEGVDPDAGSICLVGKGIVYDTGGLSIKTKTGMPGMKRDMGGAAAVLGAFRTLCGNAEAVRRPVYALLCLAENSVSDVATRPDDILTMYSGRTVEVNNTDAEGRLVLADGVAYATKHLNPHAVVDIATLTGAQGVATGRRFGALYSATAEAEASFVAAGMATGDLCHPLPYCPEVFQAEFASAVADMKNSVKDRANAQSSCAGQFVGAHMTPYIEAGGTWVHVDMAYPSFAGERGTGYGVGLLTLACMKLE